MTHLPLAVSAFIIVMISTGPFAIAQEVQLKGTVKASALQDSNDFSADKLSGYRLVTEDNKSYEMRIDDANAVKMMRGMVDRAAEIAGYVRTATNRSGDHSIEIIRVTLMSTPRPRRKRNEARMARLRKRMAQPLSDDERQVILEKLGDDSAYMDREFVLKHKLVVNVSGPGNQTWTVFPDGKLVHELEIIVMVAGNPEPDWKESKGEFSERQMAELATRMTEARLVDLPPQIGKDAATVVKERNKEWAKDPKLKHITSGYQARVETIEFDSFSTSHVQRKLEDGITDEVAEQHRRVNRLTIWLLLNAKLALESAKEKKRESEQQDPPEKDGQ